MRGVCVLIGAVATLAGGACAVVLGIDEPAPVAPPPAPDAELSDVELPDRVEDLGGEQVHLSRGWQARVLRDLSGSYAYRQTDFVDVDAATEDNAPTRLVPLVAPFEDGLAVLAGRQILELRSNGPVLVHEYRPQGPDQGGVPDAPRDLHFARPTATSAGELLVSGASQAGGDGVFAINAAWQMSVILSANNCDTVAFDPTGAFDGRGTPQRYFASSSLFRQSDMQRIVNHVALGIAGITDVEVEPSGRLAIVVESSSGGLQIGELEAVSGTYPLRRFVSAVGSGLRLVTGDLTRLPPGIHYLASGSRLVELHGDDTQAVLVESKSEGWVWSAAAVLPKEHSLGAAPVYVILESNRTSNVDRILLVTPPT